MGRGTRAGTRVLVGHVGVDAGMVMVGDPCYIASQGWTGEVGDIGEGRRGPYPYSYEGACNATLSDRGAGELGGGLAVAASSGYGDGHYPVFVDYNGEGRVVRLTVDFDWAAEELGGDRTGDDETEECCGCHEPTAEWDLDEDGLCGRCQEDAAEEDAAEAAEEDAAEAAGAEA